MRHNFDYRMAIFAGERQRRKEGGGGGRRVEVETRRNTSKHVEASKDIKKELY